MNGFSGVTLMRCGLSQASFPLRQRRRCGRRPLHLYGPPPCIIWAETCSSRGLTSAVASSEYAAEP